MKGIPSIEKQQELTEMEQKRVSEQIKKLGPDGLKQKKEELQKSAQENDVRSLMNQLQNCMKFIEYFYLLLYNNF